MFLLHNFSSFLKSLNNLLFFSLFLTSPFLSVFALNTIFSQSFYNFFSYFYFLLTFIILPQISIFSFSSLFLNQALLSVLSEKEVFNLFFSLPFFSSHIFTSLQLFHPSSNFSILFFSLFLTQPLLSVLPFHSAFSPSLALSFNFLSQSWPLT